MVKRILMLALLLSASVCYAAPASLNDPFFSYTRAEQYDSVVKTSGIHVPVRTPEQGSSYVSCTLYQPAKNGVAVSGKFPGIVMDYFAYHLVNVVFSWQGRFDFFPKRGYNVIVCDPPGSGSSPGILDQFGPAETLANYDLIEWFAKQPYSDGNIGQQGTSYGGHTTNKVAAMNPPHLKAIVPNSSMADWYEQTIYHGGIRNESISYQVWLMPIAAFGGSNFTGATKGIRRDHLQRYGEHPLYDDYWRDHSVKPHWDTFTVPALITDGWNDRYKGGTIENYQARKSNVWLLLGPWGHSAYKGVTAIGTLEETSHQLAWYDYWLKHLPKATLPRQKITSYEMPDDGSNAGWQQYSDWPPPSTKITRLYFTANKSLADAALATESSLKWVVNAEDSGSDPAGGNKKSVDQAKADAAPYRLALTSAPLKTETVIAGSVNVHLKAAFSARDGNLVARLMEVHADGTVKQISTGWLKASHYKGHDHLEPIIPGKQYDMQVRLLPTHWRFKKGSSIRISLSSGDVPDAIADANPGTVSVVTGGAGGSYAEFPILMNAN
ncbi:MAG: CocE/NonD family hydrolase [Pseudomonadota bacterium]